MLNWKLLVAGVAVILVAGVLVIGGEGFLALLAGGLGQIGSFLGSSPFGDLFSTARGEANPMVVTIYPPNFTVMVDRPATVLLGETQLDDFKGTVETDFDADTITLTTSGDLAITSPVIDTKITPFTVKQLILEGIKMKVRSGNWDISSENGSIEISHFEGSMLIDQENSSISFLGNVSSIEQR